MTEIFRIIGKNDIHFDAGATSNYLFTQGRPPRKLSTVLTRQEVLSLLPRLPLGVRPLALKHGLSVITMELNIHGADDADMEAKEHALIETLVETDVFFSNGGTMGTKGELQVKSDGASEVSFKSVFYGVVDELDARDVLGAVIKSHSMYGLRLTLYCEPYWRPSTFNHLFNGGFEFWDGVQYGGTGLDTEPDGWLDQEAITGGTHTNNREATPANVKFGTYALRTAVTGLTNGDLKGVQVTIPIAGRFEPGVTYTLSVWVQNAVITAGLVQVYATGTNMGVSWALNSGAANPTYTHYTASFTIHPSDTQIGIVARIMANGTPCAGTAYFDGMMVVRGTVVPDDFIEWHPNPGIRIGPDLLSNPGFEEWPAVVVDNEPDCWIDFEHANITGTNNRESTEVTQGCYALRINVTNSTAIDQYKGVYQDIRARCSDDVEYVLLVWLQNTLITDGLVRIRARGSNLPDTFAYNAATANDDYTLYAVTFTPTVADAWLRIYAEIYTSAAGCSGTAYIDKMMLIEASIYNGHSFVPEEWTGCGYVWNHLDKACLESPPGNECGHVNYLDIADLRGDVDSRLRIEMESLYYKAPNGVYGVGELTVARRTDPCLPCQFAHFLEAEDATTQTDWPDAVQGNRSGCASVGPGAAATTGKVIWNLGNLGYNLACQKGRFRVLAAVIAVYDGVVDANIKFKASVGIEDYYQESRWLQPLIASAWHWLDFGVFEVTGQFWGDELPWRLEWRIDYQKEAADSVYLDFLLLLPEDESVLRIPLGDHYLETAEDALWDNTFDFTLAMKRNTADAFTWHPPVQAEPLALKPEEQNRLIFAIGRYWSADFPYKWCLVHEDNGEHMLVSLKYLPQFVSPLE